MGMISNTANAAAADAVAKQQEMQMLLRGKTSEQQAVIKFFYGASGGCMHAGGMTVEEYQKKVQAKRDALNTKAMALRKLGIEEEEVKEIAPVTFEGYIFNDKVDNLVARATANTWVSSEYMITWLFFGEREVFIYTQESCQRLRPSGVFFKTFSNSSTVIPASFAASSIVTRPFLTSLTNIRMKAEKRLNGGGFRFWRCCRSTRAFVRIFLQETRTNIANEVVYHGERLRLFWQRQYRICPL